MEFNLTVTSKMNDQLKALKCFAAKKDIRYYINSVLIEVSGGKVRGVATDGACLAIAMLGSTDNPDAQYILPIAFVDSITAMKTTYGIEINGTEAKVINSAICTLVDARFPDFRRVAPPATNSEQTCGYYDFELLARISKAAKILGAGINKIQFKQNGGDAAQFMIGDNFCGVTMTYRGDPLPIDLYNAVL